MKGEETKALTEVSTEKPEGSQEMTNGWKTEDNNSIVTQQPKGQEAENGGRDPRPKFTVKTEE